MRASGPFSFVPRLALAIATACAVVHCAPARAQDAPDACIMRLDRMITGAYAEAVERNINTAREQGVRTFILELDTPGGTLGASQDLADFIFRLNDIDVIAYINDKAYSGGTMVALACKEIYIDGTTGRMGDVAPVDPAGNIMGEKIQSPLRDMLEQYALARGYPTALVKAMVTPEIEVFRITRSDDPQPVYVTSSDLRAWPEEEQARIVARELIVPAGQLLTMHATKAVEYGFARQTVSSLQNLCDVLGLKPGRVQRIFLTPSERVLTVLDMFSPLLIVAGLVLLYVELGHPGFGLPGILGLACFAAFFLIKWTLHYAHMLEVLLFVVGLVLLLIEVFLIPGFGVVGALGIVLLFVSLVLTFQQFTIPHSASEFQTVQYSLLKVLGSLLVAAAGIAVLVRFLPSIPLLGRIVHRGTLAAAFASEGLERRVPEVAGLAGAVGVALTSLRPAGRAAFGRERFDVVTEGDFIEEGEPVQVREVHGSRIVVARHEER